MLTDKQQKVYDAIRSYMDNHRYAPTLEELQTMLDLKNKHSVVQFLDYLEDKWYIERERGYRWIRLKDRVEGFQMTFSIPILWMANAGKPLMYADSSDLGSIEVSKSLLPKSKDQYFFVQVSGDSMNQATVKGKRITPNSFLLIEATSSIDDFDRSAVYLFTVNDGATVKHFKSQEDCLLLLPHSDNPKHAPIVLSPDDSLVTNGKVIDVFDFSV